MTRGIVMFCWHNVSPTPFFGSRGSQATDGFRRQMRALKLASNPISLAEAVGCLAEGRPLPARATVVTFDDGYRDNLEVAAPILRDLSIPAIFFLVPEFLSSREAPWWERLAWAIQERGRRETTDWKGMTLALGGDDPSAVMEPLARHLKTLTEAERQQAVKELIELMDPAGKEPVSPMMVWDEALQLAEMGFDIGSHSSRHMILSNESPESQLDDLRGARVLLEQGIGISIDLLAYPNGSTADFDQSTLEAAVQSGYRAAVTTISGRNHRATELLALRRFVMYPEWGPLGFGVVGRHLAQEAAFRSRLRSHRPLPSRADS